MLQLTDVVKKYGDTVILSIPNFNIPNGIYWLKGANGSGKSTLLKMIAALIPYDGVINCCGVNWKNHETLYKQNSSYSPADAALPSFLTGMEVIQFYCANRKVQEEEKIVEQFQLQEYVNNLIGTYSSGMQKRLALALAFIGAPKLIMLDEPLSTLDVQTTALMSKIIAEYHKTGSSFIITSHQDFEYNSIQFDKQLLIENKTLAIL